MPDSSRRENALLARRAGCRASPRRTDGQDATVRPDRCLAPVVREAVKHGSRTLASSERAVPGQSSVRPRTGGHSECVAASTMTGLTRARLPGADLADVIEINVRVPTPLAA